MSRASGTWGWDLVRTSSGPCSISGLTRLPTSSRCTLHPSDQLALEGPLSRVKSLKKSLRQSFRRMRRSRVSSHKRRPGGSIGEVRPQAQNSHLQNCTALPPWAVSSGSESRSSRFTTRLANGLTYATLPWWLSFPCSKSHKYDTCYVRSKSQANKHNCCLSLAEMKH